MLFILDPANYQGNAQYFGFFSHPEQVHTVLNHWISSGNQSQRGQDAIRDWALNFVSSLVFNEGEAVKANRFLCTDNCEIDRSFMLNLNFPGICEKL